MEGQLIVVEGLDGSGKTTQCRSFIKKLSSLGFRVGYKSYPDYEIPSGQEIAQYLKRGVDLGVRETALLYAGNRFETLEVVAPLVEVSDFTVLNRAVPSNQAFQAARLPKEVRPKFRRAIARLEYDWLGFPRPNLVLWLDVLPKNCLELKAKQREALGESPDVYERDLLFQQEVSGQYWEMFQEARESWCRVDCNHPISGLLPERVIAEGIWSSPQIMALLIYRLLLQSPRKAKELMSLAKELGVSLNCLEGGIKYLAEKGKVACAAGFVVIRPRYRRIGGEEDG